MKNGWCWVRVGDVQCDLWKAATRDCLLKHKHCLIVVCVSDNELGTLQTFVFSSLQVVYYSSLNSQTQQLLT